MDADMRIHTRFSTSAGESTSDWILDRGGRCGLSEFRRTPSDTIQPHFPSAYRPPARRLRVEPSIGIPQNAKMVKTPITMTQPAVSVLEISDPTVTNVGIELLDQPPHVGLRQPCAHRIAGAQHIFRQPAVVPRVHREGRQEACRTKNRKLGLVVSAR